MKIIRLWQLSNSSRFKVQKIFFFFLGGNESREEEGPKIPNALEVWNNKVRTKNIFFCRYITYRLFNFIIHFTEALSCKVLRLNRSVRYSVFWNTEKFVWNYIHGICSLYYRVTIKFILHFILQGDHKVFIHFE